ncbi:MAG: 4Fe-4S dicluster domain-containing protein [Spirochaetaceae bacterium]|nr:MAG: 4Fe-4S dicluster domain-containing protein [Spirochaetaceae bacterium]
MKQAMLIDQTKCIGCGACTVSCKAIYARASFGILRTRMKKYETGRFPHVSFRFRKHMCMHCIENAPCIEACPVNAISYVSGDAGGMVIIDDDTCIGCGNCTRQCPYQAPDRDRDRKKAEKCSFCSRRVLAGQTPFCAEACPVGAITFGNRDDVLAEGRRRAEILRAKGRSHAYVWGSADTMVLYLLDQPPEIYELPAEGYTASRQTLLTRLATPAGGVLAAAALGAHGLHLLRERRRRIEDESKLQESHAGRADDG